MQCTDTKSFRERINCDKQKSNSGSTTMIKPILNPKGSDLTFVTNPNYQTVIAEEDKVDSSQGKYDLHPNGFIPSSVQRQSGIHFTSIKRNTKAAMNFEKSNKVMKESTKMKISRNISINNKIKLDKNYYEKEIKRLEFVFNKNDVAKPYMNKLLLSNKVTKQLLIYFLLFVDSDNLFSIKCLGLSHLQR